MVFKEQQDTRHSGKNITITSGLGCPRKLLIQRMLPSAVNPVKLWAMQRGTWLHEQVGHAMGAVVDGDGQPVWWSEELNPEQCVYEGELFGVKMSCKVDALRRDYGELWDFKFRSERAARYIDVDGVADRRDACQLNMARLLIGGATGKDTSRMSLVAWVDSGGWYRTEAPLMSEEEIGRYCPGGGSTSVRTIFETLNWAMNKWEDGAGEDECKGVINSVKLVGLDMYKDKGGGNACTKYCEYKETCDRVGGTGL